ncbi:MAG: nitrite/sulfite reductase [Chloroflexi bacterium]|nr:nitrite/sulfite reductase [Chloroflexota bacterium]
MTTTKTDFTGATADPAQAHVIPILEREFDDFETEATAFLAGDREERAFIGFRLKQGTYGQRQQNRQMIRVKNPAGLVNSEQLEAYADIAEQWTPLGKGHITTRAALQFHHIPLARVPSMMRRLGDAGLSSREACGNTVRNVTADPWAGVRDDEPFDITPYAGAFVRYWVRNEISQLLPRKFKATFSASEQDDGLAKIHDLGFIPRVKVVDGQEVRGFKMVTGGGLSIFAREAVTISEFVPVTEYLKVSEAVVRIFNQADELRKNLAKARLKFLVHRVGEAAFNEMIEEELKKDWAQKEILPDDLLYFDDEAAAAPSLDVTVVAPSAHDAAAFEEWKRTAVRPQKQTGYLAIEVKVPQGDLTPEQFRGLAEILRKYGNGRARTTQWQNIVLRWIPEGSAHAVWKALGELGLGGGGIREITDVVSCPGTDSCKLGITCSMGLNRAISDRVTQLNVVDERTRRILVNISGCPNSCGQHHLGNIGFHGAAIKAGNDEDRQVPSYNVFLGGDRHSGESLRIGQLLKVKIPAKRAPEVVERFIALYEGERQDGEEFNDTADRIGPKPFEEAIRDLTVAPDFSVQTIEEFMDWERDVIYVLERGEGECAV